MIDGFPRFRSQKLFGWGSYPPPKKIRISEAPPKKNQKKWETQRMPDLNPYRSRAEHMNTSIGRDRRNERPIASRNSRSETESSRSHLFPNTTNGTPYSSTFESKACGFFLLSLRGGRRRGGFFFFVRALAWALNLKKKNRTRSKRQKKRKKKKKR